MSKRRKSKKSKPEKTVRELPIDEEYQNARLLMIQIAERIKELADSQGFDVGRIKDCAPIFEFRCIKCRSKKIALYHFEKAVVLHCTKCRNMELVGVEEEN